MYMRKMISMLTLAATMAAVILLGAGCKVAARATGPSDPFTARREGVEGTVVEFKGYAHGHRAGEEASFELMLQNDGEDSWQGRYCLLLVDQDGPVATLATDEFSLSQRTAEVLAIKARLPEGLAEGCYGLALVLPERLTSVTTITVGETDGPCVGPWPAAVACP